MVIVCKRRGYSYELKEVIELLFHKMTDDPMNNKDVKKVGPGPPGGRQPSGLREESWGGLENGVSRAGGQHGRRLGGSAVRTGASLLSPSCPSDL